MYHIPACAKSQQYSLLLITSRGDVIDIFPAENSETAIRVSLFDDEVENLSVFDPLTGQAPTAARVDYAGGRCHAADSGDRVGSRGGGTGTGRIINGYRIARLRFGHQFQPLKSS